MVGHKSICILFCDIADSTLLYQTHGDEIAHQLVAACLADARLAIDAHQGALLRTVGDAILASFDQPFDAYQAARELLDSQARNGLALRAGMHFGKVIPDNGDIYGNAVNIAARIASVSAKGELTASKRCATMLNTELTSGMSLLCKLKLKGIDEPQAIYRIHRVENHGDLTLTIQMPSRKQSRATRYQVTVGAQQTTLTPSQPKLLVGRDASNHIVVMNKLTSRVHASLELIGSQISITDQSTNGTYYRNAVRNKLSEIRRKSLLVEGNTRIGAGFDPDTDSENQILIEEITAESE